MPAFAKAGVKAIVLIATNASKLLHVQEELQKIRPNLKVLALSADISSAEQVTKAWAEINAHYTKVHVLVNNAGVECTESDKSMHEQDPDIFFKNFVGTRVTQHKQSAQLTILQEINVKGTHTMTQHFLRAALPWASATDKARIITMTSSTA